MRQQSFANEGVCVCGSSPQATAGRRQTAPAAVARRVVEDGQEQEDAAADEAVVLEEDLSDKEAGSAGPVKWVVPQWEVLAADRGGWRAGLKGLRVNESEVDVC